ncbi:hypothetical protein GCM10010459_12480 [Microbacterium schleiferi]
MANASVAGVRYEASGENDPPCASWIGVPPKAPRPTASPMIMKTKAAITRIWRATSLPRADSVALMPPRYNAPAARGPGSGGAPVPGPSRSGGVGVEGGEVSLRGDDIPATVWGYPFQRPVIQMGDHPPAVVSHRVVALA